MTYRDTFSRLWKGMRVYMRDLWLWHRELLLSEIEKHRFGNSRAANGLPTKARSEEILEAQYCFVLSTGRCGTALLTKILENSSSLLVRHNPRPGLELVSSVVHKDRPSLESLWLAVLAARFDVCFEEAFQRGRIYVETNNRISLFAPALGELLPNARFIHLVRNPADFVRSGMRRGYYAEGVVQHQRLRPKDNQTYSEMSRLEKVAWEWNEINASIEAFKMRVPADRVMTINSESLFKGDPEGMVSTVWDFLDVPNPFVGQSGAKRLGRLLERPVNKQESGSFPKYPQWDDDKKESLRRVAKLANYYGYDLK